MKGSIAMKNYRKYVLFSLSLIFLLVISGCQNNHEQLTDNNFKKIDLWVTTGFGSATIDEELKDYQQSYSIMDILRQTTEVETAYGGGFVQAINGITSTYTNIFNSDKKKDWFYWINGLNANVGANDYLPKDGDIIWWDYHDWSHTVGPNAVIGTFPQPFVNGYNEVNNGTEIWYTKNNEPEAETLQKLLLNKNVEKVTTNLFQQQDLYDRSKMTILLGEWSELKNNQQLNDLFQQGTKLGLFAGIKDQKIYTTYVNGGISESFDSNSVLIVSIAQSPGDTHPLWLIIGLNSEDIEQALTVLQDGQMIKKKVGVVISNGKVFDLPATSIF